jgi:hypothetical protein
MSATLDFDKAASALPLPHDADTPRDEARNGWIAVAVVLGGLVVGSSAFAVTGLRPDGAQALRVSVGSTALGLSSSLLREPETVGDGPQPRLDLTLTWPDLAPRDHRLSAARASWPGAAPGPGQDLVDVTIVPADDSPAPETRVASLYARFLEATVQQGPGDLITRHFRRNSPYAGEVLVFSPPDGRRVAARCETEPGSAESAGDRAPDAASVTVPAACIAEFRRHGLDVRLRFAPRLANGMELVQRRLVVLLDRMVVSPAQP